MWQPLLSGDLAERALRDASDIARAIAGLSGPGEFAPSYGADVAASLASGTAGLALTFAHLSECGVFPGGLERSAELLESATEAMATVEMDPDLFGGFTGVGWAASRLWSDPGSAAEDDPLSDVDGTVRALLDPPRWEGPYDLVSGLVGFGVYALERLPRPAARSTLERIVDELEVSAEAQDGGLTWKTRPELLTEYQRGGSPNGRYDLGVAHGVPGVVALLAQTSAAGVAVDRARPLLEGAVAWLLRQKPTDSAGFPYWIAPGGEARPSRSAWCYGDPGVASALLLAGRCAGEPAWEREAIELARRAASRPSAESGVVDAGLCHGAGGLAHVLNRIHQRTGDGELRRASVAWFERTLGMRRPGTGLAGYTTALKAVGGDLTYEPDPSLLSGAAGIALALAAAATPVEPTWDRVLLLSSPFEP